LNSEKIHSVGRFDPNSPKYRWLLWVRREARSGKFRHIFWWKINVLAALFALCLWTGGTGAVWWNAKYRRGVTDARYADLVWPWRWPRYLDAMSHHYVVTGGAAFHQGLYDRAYYYANAALALRPGDLAARSLAAESQFGMGMKPAAVQALAAGVPAAYAAVDPGYLRGFFGAAFAIGANDLVIATGSKLLQQPSGNKALDQFVAFQVAQAHFNLARPAETETLLTRWGLRSVPEGVALYARALWESGRSVAAVGVLRANLIGHTRHDSLYVTLEQIARAEGRPEDTLHYAILRQVESPAAYPPQIDLLYAYHQLGRREQERSVVDGFCSAFGSDPAAFRRLMSFAVDTGQPAIAARVEKLGTAFYHSDEAGFDLNGVEAAIEAKDFAWAAKGLQGIRSAKGQFNAIYLARVSALEAIVKLHGDDPVGETQFANCIPQLINSGPASGLRYAHYLRAQGAGQLSRDFLGRIVSAFPEFEPAQLDLVRADLAAPNPANLQADLPGLLRQAKVPSDVLAAALPLLTHKEAEPLRRQTADLLARMRSVYLPEPWTPPL
jgi:hypothetical protein